MALADPYRDLDVIDVRAPHFVQATTGAMAVAALASGVWPLLAIQALLLTAGAVLGRNFNIAVEGASSAMDTMRDLNDPSKLAPLECRSTRDSKPIRLQESDVALACSYRSDARKSRGAL